MRTTLGWLMCVETIDSCSMPHQLDDNRMEAKAGHPKQGRVHTTLGWLTWVETIDSCSALTCDDWPPSWLSTFTATVQPRHLAARHTSPQPCPSKRI